MKELPHMQEAVRVEKKALNNRVWSVHWECPLCRTKVDKGDRFCSGCGTEMLVSNSR